MWVRWMESQMWLPPASSVALGRGGSQKRKNGLCPPFYLGESCPPPITQMPDTAVPPICHWCLSSCYPGVAAQREWVWVSPCAGLLRGTAWKSKSFFHWLNSCWFLQSEVMGTYLPGIGTLGWGPSLGLRALAPKTFLPNFYPPHMGVGPAHFVSPCLCPSYRSWWMWFL